MVGRAGLSAVDGAREIGIGPGAEEVDRPRHPRVSRNSVSGDVKAYHFDLTVMVWLGRLSVKF